MIEPMPPGDWRDLQKAVAQILAESGLSVESEKTIDTVRGTANIDVFAVDHSQMPPITYLCECKHWKSSVPKTVVHSFRTIVSDYGANWGLIISSAGFQAGAYAAARNTNILLLDWQGFQELFVERWYRHYLIPRIDREAEPLISYTEPINSSVFRRAESLTDEGRRKFLALREEYRDLTFLALFIKSRVDSFDLIDQNKCSILPLKNSLRSPLVECLPADLVEATALRDFLTILLSHVRKGVQAFRELFGVME
ncbi:restriction endonuclease [Desulfofundulus kuznetsovii DSM 6115]|uniref:Restriction endonuclease n=1 Tax=Desulfofundulus kuznetsovii (strain DSM 6115 / VKM B-1805 / 17) TaxID=760568 RepID=A0AAU8PXG0_DESK7|nr:restriction endonuclease [Desulfofundulus kuznetsovii DSM 6115]